jgi:hypothetical protein
MPARTDSNRRDAAYITSEPKSGDDGPVAAIHRRRKSVMVALLGQFEELIEPLIPAGNDERIKDFKRTAREKINGLAYEGIRAAQTRPGEAVSRQTADLAERYAFPADMED